MAIYSIIHKSGAMYLNLEGSGAAYAHRNVNLYNSTASNDQKWSIASLTGVQIIYTQNNTAYALNYYRTNANCNIQIASGNEVDAQVYFRAQTDGTYKIELANHAGLFLTADVDTRNGNVSWKANTGDDKQKWQLRLASDIAPTKHSYTTGSYSSKNLKIIETAANNIKLFNLANSAYLQESPYYGVNGGWFNTGGTDKRTLNIAISDGVAVGPVSSDKQDGRLNNFCGGGVIFWNGSSFSFNDTGVQLYEGTAYLNKGVGTWAQGGFSMYLGLTDWYNKMLAENWGNSAAFMTSASERTGIVVNTSTKKVYLINCSTACTFQQFREAVRVRFNVTDSATLSEYRGLILDGGASSQFKARQPTGVDVMVAGGRKPCQIIALRDNT